MKYIFYFTKSRQRSDYKTVCKGEGQFFTCYEIINLFLNFYIKRVTENQGYPFLKALINLCQQRDPNFNARALLPDPAW